MHAEAESDLMHGGEVACREIRHERKGSTLKDAIEGLPPYSYTPPPSGVPATPASQTLDELMAMRSVHYLLRRMESYNPLTVSHEE